MPAILRLTGEIGWEVVTGCKTAYSTYVVPTDLPDASTECGLLTACLDWRSLLQKQGCRRGVHAAAKKNEQAAEPCYRAECRRAERSICFDI